MNTRAESPNRFVEWLKWSVVLLMLIAAVVGNYYYSDYSLLARVLVLLLIFVLSVAVALTTEKGQAFNRLRKEAWVEVRKVVWPSRQETIQTTLIVLAVVVLVAAVLWLVDAALGFGISWVIGSKG